VDTLAGGAEKGPGGCGPAFMTACCWASVPSGQMYNSTGTIPTRTWLKLIPFVNGAVGLYDVVKAAQGETLQSYWGGKGDW
jgi:hypothetical protein